MVNKGPLLSILAAFATFAGGTKTEAQLVLTQTLTVPHAFSYGVEKWRRGHLISVDTGQPNSATFTVNDPSGGEARTFLFSLPDTSRTWVHDFDLDATGALVFCGQIYSSNGQLAGYIAVKDPDDAQVHLIRTNPYRPWAIATAPDGTIWTVGFESVNVGGSLVANESGEVIRHFERSGKEIASAVPYGELTYAPRASWAILAATNDRIAWYAPTSGKGEVYVEMSPDLKSSTTYPGMVSPNGRGQVLGFALSEKGDAYLTWGGSRIGTYRLDRSLRQWVEIPVPEDPKNVGSILKGEEDGVLVFRSGYNLDFLKPAGQ